MKKLLLLTLAFGCSFSVLAQENSIEAKKQSISDLESSISKEQAEIDQLKAEIQAMLPPKYWDKGAFTSLNFNTVGLSNWAAGGVQSNAITLLANAYANYSKDKLNWLNNVDVSYGLLKNEGEAFRKNEDKIDYLSKLGYKASGKINYAVMANFKSQFAPGLDFTNVEDPQVISTFLAPAFINLSLGMDYKVASYLSIYLSPAAGKFTVVNDDSIAAKNIYIPATLDAQGDPFYKDNFRAEFGVFFNALFKKDFGKNVTLRSRLDLFNNYTDQNKANRKNIDVNWETAVNMRLGKYIGASLFTHLIYDNDVEVATAYNANNEAVAFGPRLQFKRVFGVGFSYKI